MITFCAAVVKLTMSIYQQRLDGVPQITVAQEVSMIHEPVLRTRAQLIMITAYNERLGGQLTPADHALLSRGDCTRQPDVASQINYWDVHQ